MVSQSLRGERHRTQHRRHKTCCQSHLGYVAPGERGEKERAVRFGGLSIRAWPPAETVNGMRWCNPRAHTGDTRTHALSLSLLTLPSFSFPSLSLSCLPASSCEKWWVRWARGDGATPPLSPSPPARLAAASQGPPLIIQTEEWCSAHHI